MPHSWFDLSAPHTNQPCPPSSQDNAAVFPIIESYLLLGAAAALTPLSAAIQVWGSIPGGDYKGGQYTI